MKTKICPCHSNKQYTLCCRPFHKGKIFAPTAEALMRSRYSAYVLHDIQYIYRTWDKNTRPSLSVLRQDNSQIFTHLEIINKSKCNETDVAATVEFVAHYFIKNDTLIDDNGKREIVKHHENSYFTQQNGKWYYVNELNNSQNMDTK